MKDDPRAKMALEWMRKRSTLSARAAARAFGTTVATIHGSAGCVEKERCTGGGCRIA